MRKPGALWEARGATKSVQGSEKGDTKVGVTLRLSTAGTGEIETPAGDASSCLDILFTECRILGVWGSGKVGTT